MRRRLHVLTTGRSLRALLRQWQRDDRGTAAIVMAAASVVLLGSAAVGVDGAHFFLARRHQQAATDMAAIAAASSLAAAGTTAGSIMAANGYLQAGLTVTPGIYTPAPTIAPSARFVAGNPANAVRVVSTTTEPFIFGFAFRTLLGVSQPGDGLPIRATATAQKQDQVAFTLGSGLASLDAGLLNTVLGGLLGTTFSLSLLDYQSLAAAQVDLFDFSDTLATQLSVRPTTYGALALGTVSQSALLNGLAATLQGSAQAVAAVRTIASAVPVGGGKRIASLVDFGPDGSLQVGSVHPSSARVSVLDMLRGVAVLGGAGHLLSLDFGSSVAGLGSTQLMLNVGEPAVGSSYFVIGPEGTTLHTAQVRLLLTTQVSGSGLPATLSVPIYLEVAPATATVSAIACAAGASAASVTLGITTGVANAAIAQVSPRDFSNMGAPPVFGPATLLNVAGLVSINAQSQVTATPGGSVPVTFSAADIQSLTAKTVSSGVSLAALASSLIGSTQVTVSLLGLGVPQPSLPSAVTSALQGALLPIDTLLAKSLSLLGVSVGTATTTVAGLHCGQGLLVN